ncbi:hypothetical protein [Streptomyces sp. NPDC088115]|uniref:hypothetical protein n=1 Tax=Streptomyces sp. NPDC088115 TaxID=3365824 RepID=UPI00382C6C9D
MLELADITKVYRGGKRAVDGMTLSEGERTVLDAGGGPEFEFRVGGLRGVDQGVGGGGAVDGQAEEEAGGGGTGNPVRQDGSSK